jgi:sterol desaturase/sphingolipid hydroxylase (fatty acid hydroxylase superfamily)
MTWLAIFRFHPINRLTTTLVDFAFLLAMGLPASALIAAMTVRHFYGAFIHADLPWSYGPLKYVFVSPAMHRWHHADDRAAYNTNYATVFSLFDVVFGTFRMTGPCNAALGVPEKIEGGLLGAYAYPFRASSYGYFLRRVRHRKARAGQQMAARFKADAST